MGFKKGKKFDFRMYVMMICSGNNLVLLYHPGYLRRSIYQYNTKDFDLAIHLTHTNQVKNLSHTLSAEEYEAVLDMAQPVQEEFDRLYKREYRKS